MKEELIQDNKKEIKTIISTTTSNTASKTARLAALKRTASALKREEYELKNIKYKTMLLSGNTTDSTPSNIANINDFLKKETNLNKHEPWIKLNKTVKLQKLTIYVTKLTDEFKLSAVEHSNLCAYLKTCLERNKLQKTKEVIYDIINNVIINIPLLLYNKKTRKFILHRTDKKTSTIKHLAPKKNKKSKTKRQNIKVVDCIVSKIDTNK